MKIRVEPSLCQGHTICSMVAPAVFSLSDEDGHSTAISGEIPEDHIDKARDAIKSCPERAIIES